MTTQLQSLLHIFMVDGDKFIDQLAGKLVNDQDALKWIKDNGKENTKYLIQRLYTKTSF